MRKQKQLIVLGRSYCSYHCRRQCHSTTKSFCRLSRVSKISPSSWHACRPSTVKPFFHPIILITAYSFASDRFSCSSIHIAMPIRSFVVILAAVATVTPIGAFVMVPSKPLLTTTPMVISKPWSRLSMAASSGGGFGGSKTSSSASSSVTLKPKQQWDRYLTMSKETGTVTSQVAVRKQDSPEWLVVGAVRSASGVALEAAVARQRSLIADVSAT